MRISHTTFFSEFRKPPLTYSWHGKHRWFLFTTTTIDDDNYDDDDYVNVMHAKQL